MSDELLLTPGEAINAWNTGYSKASLKGEPKKLNAIKSVAKAQVAKLKEHYVKWDREKVAERLYKTQGFIGWEKVVDASKGIFREQADQLKEILTGGK